MRRAALLGLAGLSLAGCWSWDDALTKCRESGGRCAQTAAGGGSGGAGGGVATGGGGTGGGGGGTTPTDGGGMVSVAPMSPNFGSVAALDSRPNVNISVTSLSITENAGPLVAPHFADGGQGFTLAAGVQRDCTDGLFLTPLSNSCTFQVGFVADYPIGPRSDDVRVDVGGGNVKVVHLEAQVTPRIALELDDAGSTFATITEGRTSVLTLMARSLAVTGTPVSYASSANPPFDFAGPTFLDGGETRSVTITFHPTGAGQYAGDQTLTVNSNERHTVHVAGDAVAVGAVRFVAQLVDFGVVDAGSTATQPFDIKNAGGTATAYSLDVSGAAFSLPDAGCPLSGTLAADAGCSGLVAFTPPGATIYGGTLTIRTPDGGTSDSTSFSGTGRKTYTLSLGIDASLPGVGVLTASGNPPCTGPCVLTYVAAGTNPSVTVTPSVSDAGLETFVFDGFQGVCTGFSCQLVMDQNHTVTGNFVRSHYRVEFDTVPPDAASFSASVSMCSTAPNCFRQPVGAPNPNFFMTPTAPWWQLRNWGVLSCGEIAACMGVSVQQDFRATLTFDEVNVAFVSSKPLPVGSPIGDGDEVCQADAADSGFPGAAQYRAWLSQGAVLAKDRVVDAGWNRADGLPFARDLFELVAKEHLYYPLAVDHHGKPVDAGTLVWTASDVNGTVIGSCNTVNEAAGLAHSGVGTWTYKQLATCGQPLPVYCFGTHVSSTPVEPLVPVSSRKVFVVAMLQGNFADGITPDVDRECSFVVPGARAYVRYGAENPWQRVLGASAGQEPPFVRPDRVVILDEPTRLARPGYGLRAPWNLRADGTSVAAKGGATGVWTGVLPDGGALGVNCSDWVLNGVSMGRIGHLDEHLTGWLNGGASPQLSPCSAMLNVYCVSDTPVE